MNLVDVALVLARQLRPTKRSLANQLERAAISVPANIAEGYGRSSRAEYLQFLAIAAGSLRELETHALIAQRNGLGDRENVVSLLALADETGRILHGLRVGLRAASPRAEKWPS